MDIRVEKTEKAIKNSFLELRSKKPLEKITIKELCQTACINKSTFYSHYNDIYALSEALETETVRSILNNMSHIREYPIQNLDIFTKELFFAFMSNLSLINILFSGLIVSRALITPILTTSPLMQKLWHNRLQRLPTLYSRYISAKYYNYRISIAFPMYRHEGF